MIKRFNQKLWSFLGTTAGLVGSAMGAEKLEGEVDYQTHCMACHLADVKTVGPSLVYIAKNYPADKFEAFSAWVKKPGKKDPRLIQMPPMGHVPADAMARIHNYVIESSKGKTEKGGGKRFAPFKEPKRPLPYVVRGFLPDTSPASVAIVMKDSVSVCWDTDACRLRYIWSSDRTSLNSYFGPAKIGGKDFYKEVSKTLWNIQGAEDPKFLGYRLIDGYPEFHYKMGSIEVKELVTRGSGEKEVQRRFTTSGIASPVSLNLENEGELTITSDSGSISQNKLTLTPSEASTFTLTLQTK